MDSAQREVALSILIFMSPFVFADYYHGFLFFVLIPQQRASQQIFSLGFSDLQARFALHKTRNRSLEIAIEYIFSHSDEMNNDAAMMAVLGRDNDSRSGNAH